MFSRLDSQHEFTKTLAPVVQLLHTQGIRVHAYLDDWIIWADSLEQSRLYTHQTIHLLRCIGWTRNCKKSMLVPSHILDFLGLPFNLNKVIISPRDSFLDSLTSVLSRLLTSTVMPVCKISSITSRISLFAPFIHHGRLQLRLLQFWIKRHWAQHRQSWDTPLQLDAKFLSHLRWFNRQDVLQGVPLHLQEPRLFFFTDASLTGWGASWQDSHLSGQWSHQDSYQHFKCLELETIWLAFLQWGPQWHNQTVRVYCNNSTAVAFIRKQGGTHSISLFNKTLELFHLLDQFWILFNPIHLPGARNVTADALSRLNSPSSTEWRLPQETLFRLLSAFGTPLADMFATAENRLTPQFSPYPDDRAWVVNALSISWDSLGLVCAFPPAPIVPKTFQKIKDSWGAMVILIASQHPFRPWHPYYYYSANVFTFHWPTWLSTSTFPTWRGSSSTGSLTC